MKDTSSSSWEWYPTPPSTTVPLIVRRRVLSPELRNYRDLVVALPPSYESDPARRYPVVYMQDGQNLFDPTTSYAGDWHLLDTLAELAEGGVEAIVVGIPNTGIHRLYEYSPFRDPRGGGGGDRYLAFVAGTVKPIIDRQFRTLPGRADTSIAGSSMGGLISLYALYRYADIFGAAGALSPSIWFANRAVLDYVAECADLAVGRLYLDIGLHEPPAAVADARALRDLQLDAGRQIGRDLDYVEDEGGVHDEAAWGRRVARALPFLLGRD